MKTVEIKIQVEIPDNVSVESVAVCRNGDDFEDGWDNEWPPVDVDRTVVFISNGGAIGLYCSDVCEPKHDWDYPYFVLEPTKGSES
jgi:hypothetical protein